MKQKPGLKLTNMPKEAQAIKDSYVEVATGMFIGSQDAFTSRINGGGFLKGATVINLSEDNTNEESYVICPQQEILDSLFTDKIPPKKTESGQDFVTFFKKCLAQIDKTKPIYINCSAGMSRSVLLAGLLYETLNKSEITRESLHETLKNFQDKRYSQGAHKGKRITDFCSTEKNPNPKIGSLTGNAILQTVLDTLGAKKELKTKEPNTLLSEDSQMGVVNVANINSSTEAKPFLNHDQYYEEINKISKEFTDALLDAMINHEKDLNQNLNNGLTI